MNKYFDKIEKNPKGGFYLALIFSLGLGIMISLSKIITPQITTIEITFVVFLVTFLLNYSLIRNSNLLPYIEDESLNY